MQRHDKMHTSLALGSGMDNTNMQDVYQEYVAKYGEDNAELSHGSNRHVAEPLYTRRLY